MAAVATMPSKDARTPEAPHAAANALALMEHQPQPHSMATIEQHPEWALLSRIPMKLTASIPMPQFRVKDLLALKPGSMVKSQWLCTDDVLLKIGAVQLSFSEFEVVEQRMAIRLTRLA